MPESGRGQIYHAWLLETGKWTSLYFRHDYSQDLFVVFQKCIDDVVQSGGIPRDEVYERATLYIDSLRQQRAPLATQMGIDLGLATTEGRDAPKRSKVKRQKP